VPKDLKEFDNLQATKPAASKTSNEDLMKFLSESMHTTKEVATFLNVENGTAFSRLKRLEKSGVVTKKYDGTRTWWVTRKAVGLEDLPPEVPTEAAKEE
jgi:DNA-binding MarR family transcriptional regulator